MAIVDIPERVPDLLRVRLLMVLMTVGMGAILARLWYLQVANGEVLQEESIENQRRLIRRPPPRGQIEDANGEIVATNRSRIVVSVVPAEAKKHADLIPNLATLMEMAPEEIEYAIEENQTTPYEPVSIDKDVSIETATRIEEQRLNLPGVMIGPEPLRSYPDGPLFGHLLGQMGQIPPEELKARKSEGYRPGDYCGKMGLERAYDKSLRGKNGGREVEVDAQGRLRRQVNDREPIPGATVRLTIDKKLQKVAYDALADWASRGKPGAAVAIDPRDGAVLAMVSVPSYDPNLFVNGISKDDYAKLRDDVRSPLLNRAIAEQVAPGSTFKVITALAGLETKAASAYNTAHCSGSFPLGGHWVKHCHKLSGHGTVNLVDSLARSCDVYFYELGQRLGPDRMAEYAKRFGLGKKTEIDLVRPGDRRVEQPGTVPDPEWKKRRRHEGWVGGDTVDMAIGQSFLECTPLQMCNVAAAIANNGTVFRPQLVRKITAFDNHNQPVVVHQFKPIKIRSLGCSAENIGLVKRGMRAVMQPGGTGAASALPGIEIAGKTGTAQKMIRGKMENNAWFIGYAPADNPRIAICVFVEQGGHGGETAAPIARKLFAQYFKIKVENTSVAPTTD